MSDEPKKPLSRRSKRRDANLSKAADAKAKAASVEHIKTTYPLGGRPTLLDPDPETLKKTVQNIIGCGQVLCTLEETASVLGVHTDTLREFFLRYPMVKEFYEDGKNQGKASLRRNQFKLSETHPAAAMHLGAHWLGQVDLQKAQYIEQQKAAHEETKRHNLAAEAQQKAEFELRERQIALMEEERETRKGGGPRIPINIRDLTTTQLQQLLERIRMAKSQKANMARDITPAVTVQNR